MMKIVIHKPCMHYGPNANANMHVIQKENALGNITSSSPLEAFDGAPIRRHACPKAKQTSQPSPQPPSSTEESP